TGLEPGEYCVSIPMIAIQNIRALQSGLWTYPEEGVAETLVTVGGEPEEAVAIFGWDYTRLPRLTRAQP
ncbi:MAG TPA: hypothetical protein VKY39_07170, partial [Aggregatilineales bacterium]|nr:hypothetical protein [Aggregatilineales bacterium]